MKKLITLVVTYFISCYMVQSQSNYFYSKAVWKDNTNIPINAHGGGILFDKGTYYWYGEYKSENTTTALKGVSCYSSTDLYHWRNRGIALQVSSDPNSDIAKGCILERPKVIYNPTTKKFVMWFHLELRDKGYDSARAGVAVSSSPEGPFTYIESKRVNAGIYPKNMPAEDRNYSFSAEQNKEWWTPEWYSAIRRGMFVKRDFKEGQMSRDMTLFVDDNGKAYHIYSSEDNLTLQIAELSDDYLTHSGKYFRIAPGGHNEAPAIMKYNGTYWMITSGCTGWEPNAARLFSASNIYGPWKQYDNPCQGTNKEKTFGGQSTFLLQVEGLKNAYIFMADEWRPKHPIDSRYIWLPVLFKNNIPYIAWIPKWNLDVFTKRN